MSFCTFSTYSKDPYSYSNLLYFTLGLDSKELLCVAKNLSPVTELMCLRFLHRIKAPPILLFSKAFPHFPSLYVLGSILACTSVRESVHFCVLFSHNMIRFQCQAIFSAHTKSKMATRQNQSKVTDNQKCS